MPPARDEKKKDRKTTQQIGKTREKSEYPKESPTARDDLKDDGVGIGPGKAARLMRENGLNRLTAKARRRTAGADEGNRPAPDPLDQEFTTSPPNEKRVSDTTCVKTGSGWSCLRAFVDLFNGEAAGGP